MRAFVIIAMISLLGAATSQAKSVIYPVGPELRSDHFHVTIAGRDTVVAHAATTYYFLNFALKGKTKISVTSDTDGYWEKGVEVQPWRWGIRPSVTGRTITFEIAEPMKIAISRPGEHGAGAEMLFLFANAPEVSPPKPGRPGIRYYGPGTYHENIDAKSGENIYLAPGAVVFGALNLWEVENVKVWGRGTMVYDGPQNPNDDDGWMHKPNWHVIVMDHARNIEISGITLIVRSRTWMIQMLGSRNLTFDNVKVIGGCAGNANQDGMDWLGGGDTVVRDSFFRASDDVFAIHGNWLGYDPQLLATPGPMVNNILIENSVLSTSISNVVRVSWPLKVFDSNHFTLMNSDVIHMGMGGCKVPFGLLEIWDDPGGKGQQSDYSFENIRLEDWYSLLQLRQHNPAIRGITLKNIWALESPSLVPSVLSGDVSGVTLQNVKIGGRITSQDSEVPLTVEPGAGKPSYAEGDGPKASFHFSPPVVKPGMRLTLEASKSEGKIKKYEWLFGDGTRGKGRVIHHTFPDAMGTLLDGSGRFRVLLKVTDASGREDWASRSIIVTDSYEPALSLGNDADASFHYRYYEGDGLRLNDLDILPPVASGEFQKPVIPQARKQHDYAFVFDGALDVPADGGYTFLLIGNDSAELRIDSHLIAVSPLPKAQVCGTPGNMAQLATGSIGLRAGKHMLRVATAHTSGEDDFAVKWQGPAGEVSDVFRLNAGAAGAAAAIR